MRKVHIYKTKEELAHQSARIILKMIQNTLRKKDQCMLALTGGRTPVAVNQQIIYQARRFQIDWSLVHFFLGDERYVPPDHDDSNFKMNYNTLLIHLPVSDSNIHRVKTEQNIEVAAEMYELELLSVFDFNNVTNVPAFDIILLGMGSDGHTASLFPETSALKIRDHLFVSNYVAKLDTCRLTLTYPIINNSKNVLFMVTGHEKRQTLDIIWNGKQDVEKYPAQGIQPKGNLVWCIDQDAAPVES